MLKLSYFEAFNAVMLSGSTTAAALMMRTSQPNISRSIARLEKATGLTLFDRLPGKLVPTPDGQALFREVQRSYVGLNKLAEAANRILSYGSGVLRIGGIHSLSLSLMPTTVRRFSETFPQVTVSVQVAHSTLLSQWVMEHSFDLAMVSYPSDDRALDTELLYSTDGVCIMPTSHRLAEKAVVTPKDLCGERFITFPTSEPARQFMDRVFAQENVSISHVIETPYSAITCSLVVQGAGIAVVDPFIAREHINKGITARPFAPAPRHTAFLISAKGRSRTRPMEAFVDVLKNVIREEEARTRLFLLS